MEMFKYSTLNSPTEWLTSSISCISPAEAKKAEILISKQIKKAQIEAVEKTKDYIIRHLAKLGKNIDGFLTIPTLEKSIKELTYDQIIHKASINKKKR